MPGVVDQGWIGADPRRRFPPGREKKGTVMAQVRRYMNLINGWEQVLAASEGLTHLEASRTKLQGLIEQARSQSTQQGSHTASRQQATKDLKQTLRNGQIVVDLLRTGAKDHYGPDNERLVEFGMQPFRGRTRTAPTPEPEDVKPATATLPAPVPTPDTTK
jgi:hypothetical protein